MNKSIFLIGYRATGKSIVGKRLASLLSLDFIDLDEWIKDQAGKEILEIVAERGWKGFRKMEREALSRFAASSRPLIVSCGGGAVLHGDVWPAIRQNAVVVWLKARPDTIVSRMTQDEGTSTARPRLKEGDISIEEEVELTLRERLPLYSKFADLQVETDRLDPDQVAQKIIKEVAG